MKPKTQKAIETIDFNIQMFERNIRPDVHPDCLAHGKARVAELRKERAEILAWDADPTVKLSYHAAMWMYEMPAWGYKGT